MSLKSRWNRFNSQLIERERAFDVRYFDRATYVGSIRCLLFWCAAAYFLWNIDNLLVWWDSLWGVASHIDPGKQKWARTWALIIGIPPIIVSVDAILALQSRRASGQGQPPQNEMPETKAKEEVGELEAFLIEQKPELALDELPPLDKPDLNDAPQSPVGIPPSPAAEPPKRFGNVRLEDDAGHATLVVSKKRP